MAVAFVATAVLRFAWARFGNDHFTHLSRARQILLGDWPIRDFFDPGQFLHYYLSAGAQLVFGYNLFGEAVLTIFFMALAAAITFGLSACVSRSVLVATGVTVVSVIAFPRLYNYPKVFLYPTALWLAWWYAQRPSARRVASLAAFSVLAFLFRYDHGAYIGVLMLVLMVLVHAGRWHELRARLVRYLVVGGVLVLPFVGYVQWAAGVPQYIQQSLAPAQVVGRVSRRVPEVQLAPDAAASAASSEAAGAPAPAVSLADRWLTTSNALWWFTTATTAVPYLALVFCVWGWARGTIHRAEAAAVTAMAVLGVVITRTLVGNEPNARLADVVAPMAVLSAWVSGRVLAVPRTWSLLSWLAGRVVLVVLLMVTLWSVGAQALLRDKISDTDLLRGPEAAWANLQKIYRRLHLRPIDYWAPEGEDGPLEALTRYALRCTAPRDRLLIAGAFAPDVFFFAERGFAGGQVHFLNAWHESPADQRLTIARIERESVPVALIGDDEDRFRRRFSAVAAFIDARFEQVPFSFEGDTSWRVLVERGRQPSGTYAELGLPCYVDQTRSERPRDAR